MWSDFNIRPTLLNLMFKMSAIWPICLGHCYFVVEENTFNIISAAKAFYQDEILIIAHMAILILKIIG